jgi:predicted AAA+ superfamily ATPase
MSGRKAVLERIAAALDRLSPPPPPAADPLAHPAYIWRDSALVAAHSFAPLPLDRLTGIDLQKSVLLENSRRLAAGLPAHDALLWGARGAGKSALVKATTGALQDEGAGIALIEVASDALHDLPALFAGISAIGRAFVIFIDDIGFEDGAGGARLLRSMLDGGAEARPNNARLYVTSNRRHILSRDMSEQDSPINPRDVVDDRLALADRFGLALGFHACSQDEYLAIVGGYAADHDLAWDEADALEWARRRGARSGRVAWHYVVELAGRAGKRV